MGEWGEGVKQKGPPGSHKFACPILTRNPLAPASLGSPETWF
jgi:hypothetical protein